MPDMPATRAPRRGLHSHAEPGSGAERELNPTLTRLGGFSDGVFAFAATLLILTIRIPNPADANAGQGLLTLLTEQWRSYLTYALSFILVGINWTNYRVMLAAFARANHTLIWLVLLYLMVAIAFIPVPTAVLGVWLGPPHSHSDQVVAAVFYGAYATVGSIIFNIVWWYGAYIAKLTVPELSDSERRAHTLAWLPGPAVIAVLTAVAFLSPTAAVAGFVAVVLLYVLPLPRLIVLKRLRGGR